MIAIALACDPKVLIADEATTALDVTVQAQIIELMKELREKLGMAIIWITHDLGVVAGIADHVAVMYGGQIVEYSTVDKLYNNPGHPYTQALLETLPNHGEGATKRLLSIPGQAPNLRQAPTFCPFAPRCQHVMEKCRNENPKLRPLNDDQEVACWLQEG